MLSPFTGLPIPMWSRWAPYITISFAVGEAGSPGSSPIDVVRGDAPDLALLPDARAEAESEAARLALRRRLHQPGDGVGAPGLLEDAARTPSCSSSPPGRRGGSSSSRIDSNPKYPASILNGVMASLAGGQTKITARAPRRMSSASHPLALAVDRRGQVGKEVRPFGAGCPDEGEDDLVPHVDLGEVVVLYSGTESAYPAKTTSP